MGKRMTATRGGAVERLARLETQMDGVKTALDRGSVGFEKMRQTIDDHASETRRSIDELKTMMASTHAACAKHDDLTKIHDRIGPLETFRDRVKRYGGIGAAVAAGILGSLTLFGPSRVAEAFRKLWE